MATERLNIVVNERGARVVKGKIQDIGRGAKQADGAVKLLRRALGTLGAALIIRKLIQLSDSFTRVQNNARIVSENISDVNDNVRRLFEIANKTRAPVEALTGVFLRGSLAAQELGASQEQLFKFTELVGQGLAIQGTGVNAARGALQQLSQALGSSIVRGEEFNSILEGAFPLAQAAARGLDRAGGSVARLRTLVIQGKVTNVEFFNALLSQSDALAALFARTNPTISQSFTVLENSITQVIGEFNNATGVSQSFATALLDVGIFISANTGKIINLGKALLGTLDPTADMSAGMKLFASTLIVVTFAITQLVSVLTTTVSTVFEAVGNQIGGVAAAIGFALEGEFALAGQTIADSFSDSGDIIIVGATELKEDLIASTTDTIETLVQIWDKGARLIQSAQADALGGSPEKIALPSAIDPVIQRLIDSQKKLLVELLLQESALVEAIDTGEEYTLILARMETNAIAAQTGMQGLAFDINATREEIAALNLEQANIEFLAGLQTQNDALKEAIKTGRDLNLILEEMAIRQAFIGDQKGLQEALDLAQANFKLREQLKDSENAFQTFLKRARENAQDILGDALANAFSGGFDNLPGEFAKVLAKLAAQFFASEIFRALGNLGSAGGGGIIGALGTFFGGNFAQGGQFQVPGSGGPDSVPTLLNLSPRETVTVTPPNQPAPGSGGAAAPIVNVPAPMVIVVDSEEKARALMNGAAGEQATLKHIRNNPNTVRAIT